MRSDGHAVPNRKLMHITWMLPTGDSVCEEARVGSDDIMFEVGRLAPGADGACVVSLGQTQVLATVWSRARDAWMRRDADRQLQVRALYCTSRLTPANGTGLDSKASNMVICKNKQKDELLNPVLRS